MFFKIVFSAAFVALSVNAAAIPTEGTTFKFMIEDPVAGNYYLKDASGKGTQDASEALACELSDDVLMCGGKGFPDFSGDMTMLATTGSSKGWSIDEENNISWSARPDIKFSIGLGSSTDMWAEICPHHGFAHGIAKAVFDTEEEAE